MKKLYVIADSNGAGKTTASYTILPDILECKEFVNADEIARGLSPFKPHNASIQASKLILNRIKKLIESGNNFAFETTLAIKSHMNLLKNAKEKSFQITLLFFWLSSPKIAVSRAKNRIYEGGHDIPEEVIYRRYKNGLKNFFNLYMFIIDNWLFIDNSGENYEIIAEGANKNITINNKETWNQIKSY
ncbi:MAG: zeta toxin family protein [Flavobacteriales bacterium]